MKTQLIDRPPFASLKIPGCSRLARISRALLVTSCVPLVSFATAPEARAAGPDGQYEFTSIGGLTTLSGEQIIIPLTVVKKLVGVSKSNKITIENNKLKFNKDANLAIVKSLAGDSKTTLDATFSGSTSLTLNKTGTNYTGELKRPLAASFVGSFIDQDVSGKLITDISATVKDRKLKLVISLSGDINGGDFGGKLVLTGKR